MTLEWYRRAKTTVVCYGCFYKRPMEVFTTSECLKNVIFWGNACFRIHPTNFWTWRKPTTPAMQEWLREEVVFTSRSQTCRLCILGSMDASTKILFEHQVVEIIPWSHNFLPLLTLGGGSTPWRWGRAVARWGLSRQGIEIALTILQDFEKCPTNFDEQCIIKLIIDCETFNILCYYIILKKTKCLNFWCLLI